MAVCPEDARKRSSACASPAASPPRCSTSSRRTCRPGVTTGKLNDLCHDYMVDVQQTVPAPLNYAPPGYKPFPKSICTSVNHLVCHGVPGEKELKPGDIVNIDITVIKDGFHGDYEPHVLRRRARDPGAAPVRGDLRMHVARHRRRCGRARAWATSAHAIQSHAEKHGFSRGARILRPRHRPQVPRGAAGPALRAAGHRAGARAGHDLHRRADDQRRQARHPRARRRLDHRHQGPQPVGAVGAHRARSPRAGTRC